MMQTAWLLVYMTGSSGKFDFGQGSVVPEKSFFFFFVTDLFIFPCPKYPDPSKLAILRTQTLLMQVQNLFEGPVILRVDRFFFKFTAFKDRTKMMAGFFIESTK